jgi:hypothetical protein
MLVTGFVNDTFNQGKTIIDHHEIFEVNVQNENLRRQTVILDVESM